MSNAGKTLRKWPQLRGLHGNDWARQYQKLRAAENVAKGLTVRGKKRATKRWPELRGKSKRVQNRIYMRSQNQSRIDSGLTVRGIPRKYKIWKELSGLSGAARKSARWLVWYRQKLRTAARVRIRALLTGAALTTLLKKAA